MSEERARLCSRFVPVHLVGLVVAIIAVSGSLMHAVEAPGASLSAVEPASHCAGPGCIKCQPSDCGTCADDGNPCTDETCGVTCSFDFCDCTCISVPRSNGSCDDNNACTTHDTCESGTCIGTPATGTSCDDGNVCTTSDTCSSGTCVGTPISCNDINACTLDSCDPATGGCTHAPVTCSDGNPCTLDSCDPATGCRFDPTAGAPCSDGNPCTTGDVCAVSYSGVFCQPGVQIDCSDGNACTADHCDPSTGSCLHDPVGCDDGNACTLDSCDALTGCVHVGEPGEAGPIAFTSLTTLEWSATSDTSTYNTYRGLAPTLGGMGSLPRPYSHVCLESGDAQFNGATLTVDDEALPDGAILYYLVDGELSCGEGTLGTASDGTLRPNPFPCPTPPP